MKRFGQMLILCGLWWTAGMTRSSEGAGIQVTIENLQPSGGFYFTPVWLGFHDSSFDLFDQAAAASLELEAIAEEGNVAPLATLFNGTMNANGTPRAGAVVMSPAGFPGAPVFDPGESVTEMIDVSDPSTNRYLTFASMVIPSNDAFFGSGDPLAFEVFIADGTFAGPLTIDISSSSIYDAGTEANDALGAAFSALGGTGTTENGVVGPATNLDNFLNTATAAGTTITSSLSAAPLARIHIRAVPEPSALALLMAALPWCRRPRR